MNEALLLIDIQNIYFNPGEYELNNPDKAAANAARVLHLFRKQGKCVIHVKHDFGVSKDNIWLNDIHKLVEPLPNEPIVIKKCPSSFLHTNLLDLLKKKQIDSLVVVGMMSHMCVDTTVRACQDYGFQVTVIEDACTTKNLNLYGQELNADIVHKAFMSALSGAFAKVLPLDIYMNNMII